jgi:glycosyltransferase involved in cell wall biosynthesis
MPRSVAFFVPGDLGTLTGGYGYDREIIAGLRALGWHVEIEALSDTFPAPTQAALVDADRRFERASGIVVVDGLALPGLAPVLRRHCERLTLVGLVHHPVALEPDLDSNAATRLHALEADSYAMLAHIVCTSRWTAEALADFGVAPARIDVVEPATQPGNPAHGSGTPCPNLLCVATLTPRKGHAVLLRALHSLRHLCWHLHCIGSLDRDPACATAIEQQIVALDLVQRVTLHGELPPERLAQHYESADLFVLASRLEGYGMVLAEALAHGLPIVATAGGAVARTVPAEAARLVAPDDAAALAAALEAWLCDGDLRTRMRVAALDARSRRRDWTRAADEFDAVMTARL